MSPHAISPTRDAIGEPALSKAQHEYHAAQTADQRPAHSDAIVSNSRLTATPEEDLHDLICLGFGPASLAIAIALHDALESPERAHLNGLQKGPLKVAFLERQSGFAWHSGMLLEGAKMQITFIKDMATLRNPCSPFTFLNYLHCKGRLVHFTNLNTFLPQRVEFEDYLRWCATSFSDVVSYGQEVQEIATEKSAGSEAVSCFTVRSKDTSTGRESLRRARHVVVAIGGRPDIPKPFPTGQPRIIHSSAYVKSVRSILKEPQGQHRIAIIGSGQSAAEIFDNIQSQFPQSRTHLIIRGSALRPSDDSPFVNEIFNPEQTATFYDRPAETRRSINAANRNTNYSVVRPELLDRIYNTLYHQRLRHESEHHWPHRILPHRAVLAVAAPSSDTVRLELQRTPRSEPSRETVEYDLVVLATGYRHNGHEELLAPLLKSAAATAERSDGERWTVGKDYRLHVAGVDVSPDAGIWLQGCNEETHGLADTLLSGLAVRGGEIVRSIFGGGGEDIEAEPELTNGVHAG